MGASFVCEAQNNVYLEIGNPTWNAGGATQATAYTQKGKYLLSNLNIMCSLYIWPSKYVPDSRMRYFVCDIQTKYVLTNWETNSPSS